MKTQRLSSNLGRLQHLEHRNVTKIPVQAGCLKSMRPSSPEGAQRLKPGWWKAYYLISVLDDYSRFILAWDLKVDMTAQSISEVVEQAIESTGQHDVPVDDRVRLLTDRGPGYLARTFEDYLRMLSIQHVLCSPHHPQTNGKLERFHQTLKARVNLLVYTSPESLRAAMADIVFYCAEPSAVSRRSFCRLIWILPDVPNYSGSKTFSHAPPSVISSNATVVDKRTSRSIRKDNW